MLRASETRSEFGVAVAGKKRSPADFHGWAFKVSANV
jgi:hypothetical protein